MLNHEDVEEVSSMNKPSSMSMGSTNMGSPLVVDSMVRHKDGDMICNSSSWPDIAYPPIAD
jgi:hypothetical protein